MEILPEGLVLDMVPADPDTEAETTAGQKVNVGRLSRDECRLALGKDQDAGGETDSLGDPSQMGKHHERVVEWVVLGVWAGELRCSIGVDGAEHMVVREEVVKAQVLGRSSNSPNRARVSSKLDLRVDHTDLHGFSLPLDRRETWPREKRIESLRQVKAQSWSEFACATLTAQIYVLGVGFSACRP
jgi:hypothetical protein